MHTVRIAPFYWSGKNSYRDRKLASVCLRKQLLAHFSAEPDVCHYVVAHSHGGNVALRAVNNSMLLARAVKGIVSIATPFIVLKPSIASLALVPYILTEAVMKAAVALVGALTLFLIAGVCLLPVNLLVLRFVPHHLVKWFRVSYLSPHSFTIYKVEVIVGFVLSVLALLVLSTLETVSTQSQRLRNNGRRIMHRYSCIPDSTCSATVPLLVLS